MLEKVKRKKGGVKMVDTIYFTILLICYSIVCFGSGIEFAAWIYHKERKPIKRFIYEEEEL